MRRTVAGLACAALLACGSGSHRTDSRSRPPESCQGVRGDPSTIVAFDAKSGSVRWERAAGASGRNATMVGSLAIIGGNDGRIRAFDVTSGDERWCAPGGQTVVSGGGLVATALPASTDVVAYDGLSGTERWRADLGSAGTTSPAVELGLAADAAGVYVGLTDPGAAADVVALDAQGNVRWTFDRAACTGTQPNLPPPMNSDATPLPYQPCFGAGTPSMVLAGTRLVVEDVNAHALVALDTSNGAVAWRVPYVSDDGEVRPQVANSSVVLATKYPRGGPSLLALDAIDGHELWSKPTPAFGQVLSDATLFSVEQQGPESHAVTALDAATGATRWDVGDRGIAYYPGAVGGLVLLPISDDGLLALEATTGKTRWQVTHPNPAQGGDVPDSSGYGAFAGDNSVVVAVITALPHHEED